MKIDRHDLALMLVLSFRYALGRKTMVVGEVKDLIVNYKDVLNSRQRYCMKRDILEAVDYNQAGQEMDIKVWLEVLEVLDAREDNSE